MAFNLADARRWRTPPAMTNPKESAVWTEGVLRRLNEAGIGGRNLGWVQMITSAEPWKRRAFNGYAQVRVQSTGPAGVVTLTASGRGLREAKLDLRVANLPWVHQRPHRVANATSSRIKILRLGSHGDKPTCYCTTNHKAHGR